jgi:hypothetical protein
MSRTFNGSKITWDEICVRIWAETHGKKLLQLSSIQPIETHLVHNSLSNDGPSPREHKSQPPKNTKHLFAPFFRRPTNKQKSPLRSPPVNRPQAPLLDGSKVAAGRTFASFSAGSSDGRKAMDAAVRALVAVRPCRHRSPSPADAARADEAAVLVCCKRPLGDISA